MKPKVLRLMMTVILLIPVIVLVSCATQSQESEIGGLEVASATVISTVQSIDAPNRTVTLKGPDGTLSTYRLGKDAINFDQIEVGDQVKATVVDSLAVFIRKGGGPPSVGVSEAVALAPKGAKPGIVMADTAEMTARIRAVNTANRTVTLEDVEGKPRVVKVGPDVNLAELKKGDDVVVRYTEALAILVEKP